MDCACTRSTLSRNCGAGAPVDEHFEAQDGIAHWKSTAEVKDEVKVAFSLVLKPAP